ncbi:MAG: hypothetical protein DI637_01530 [Citromicrobium sp.]|nr:MAG: hypothetical protein DI637_01530 [Citromicrobium sp.]
MMKFYDTLDGTHFPLAEISSIGLLRKSDVAASLLYHIVRLDGGGYDEYGLNFSKYEVAKILHPVRR